MMKQKDFNHLAGVVLTFGAGLHFIRAVLGWEMVINGWQVPLGLSWVVVVIVGSAAHKAFTIKK